jgi:hypothetical protein
LRRSLPGSDCPAVTGWPAPAKPGVVFGHDHSGVISWQLFELHWPPMLSQQRRELP